MPKQPVKVETVVIQEGEREVLYPEVVCKRYWKGADGPITEQLAKDLLLWETEDEYKARMLRDDPKLLPEQCRFDTPLLIDFDKNPVMCHASEQNRDLRIGGVYKIAQDLLQRNWAGPTAMPGETPNLESIVIGKTGLVNIGNHRLIGLVIACQMWRKQISHWSSYWPEADGPPVMESPVWFGASESPQVVQTYDNVIPRDEADMLFTSEEFLRKCKTHGERKEVSKMLAAAIDLLWTRTGQADIDQWSKVRTHSVSKDFLHRHPKLEKCVMHLFNINKEKVINFLKLSPGQCAAMMYLMGSCHSDIDHYRNNPTPPYLPKESALDWQHYDFASAFWRGIASKSEETKPIRDAIAGLVDVDTGSGGRVTEKQTLLARAWNLMLNGETLAWEKVEGSEPTGNLVLEYGTRDGEAAPVLTSEDNFGGIDVGRKVTKNKTADPKVSQEAVEAEKKRIREEAAAESAARIADKKAKLLAAKAAKKAAKPLTQAEVNAEQTAKAAAADAVKEAEEAGRKAADIQATVKKPLVRKKAAML